MSNLKRQGGEERQQEDGKGMTPLILLDLMKELNLKSTLRLKLVIFTQKMVKMGISKRDAHEADEERTCIVEGSSGPLLHFGYTSLRNVCPTGH